MDTTKLLLYNQRCVNKSTTWILFLFLGWSYGSMDKIGTQILYYLTIGGLGFWTLYRLFTLNKSIREYNKIIAYEVGIDKTEMASLGLI